MKKKLIAWILAAAVVAGGGYAAYTKFGNSKDGSEVKNSTASSDKKDNEKTKEDVTENKDETKKVDESSQQNAVQKKPTQQTQQKQNSAPKSQEEVYMGNWVIRKVIAYGPAETYSKSDINNLMGKRLTFSPQKATCFGDSISYLNESVQNPMYSKSSVFKDDFEAQNKVTFNNLGVSGSTITMIEVKDSSGKGCTFYIKGNNTMILYGGGVYFEIDRE
ncbi:MULTISPECIES: hypothetical protein [Clostridium]|uniref:hypothetical protein n=1 Tax=Clostridium TaxID=1485 RepID=UPI000826849D|nr:MULTISPECIES: hypothetical protein [Clostridium]PJI08183.1 hypothetical protein CUB90_10050 [Clostridium sp. CT7]